MRWCCATTTGSATPLYDNSHDIALLQSSTTANDTYGPMQLRLEKTAVLVTEAGDEGLFLDRLKSSGWHLNVTSAASAVNAVQQARPLLLLLDYRLPELITLARTLHQQTEEDVLYAVISDRPLSDKKRKLLSKANIFHAVQWNSHDIGLIDFVAKLSNRLRCLPALFAILDESKLRLDENDCFDPLCYESFLQADQAIEVCDETRVVQYVNRAYETVTGCLRQEVIGKPESELRRKSLPRPEKRDEMERRKSTDWKCIRVPTSSLNSQYVYMKRRSVDNSMYRDVSLKSLRSQTNIADPTLNEVLSMLRDVAQRVEGEPAQTVREAVKALSTHELYAPAYQRIREGERITNQYYDGLIRLHHPTRQRKRSVVDAYRDKRGSHGERRRVSADVKNALENDNTWNFDVLQLEKVTEHHALSQLGMKIFDRWKVCDVLGCNEDILSRWLSTIEMHYHCDNTYHNSTHAADVLQATAYFLESSTVAAQVSESHAVAALIAAAVHDLDHPGRGNAFLINTRQALAVLYNDHSVLENHHVALCFQLTLQPNGTVNIFANLSREEFHQMRMAVVEMVLATDISRHFEYLDKFNNVAQMNLDDISDDIRESNSLTVCNMLVKCADISNPTREWSICQKWANRIVEEYFDQTREEREKGLPVTMEVFDRKTCNIPITQCGFIDMFVREAFTTFSDFAELSHLTNQLESNYKQWKSQKESWTPANNLNLNI